MAVDPTKPGSLYNGHDRQEWQRLRRQLLEKPAPPPSRTASPNIVTPVSAAPVVSKPSRPVLPSVFPVSSSAPNFTGRVAPPNSPRVGREAKGPSMFSSIDEAFGKISKEWLLILVLAGTMGGIWLGVATNSSTADTVLLGAVGGLCSFGLLRFLAKLAALILAAGFLALILYIAFQYLG